ncbi:class I SAM-dependent methyltransferase [Hyphococcus sp.]|uniref:class I SAM-dependent methyltransferase n=1 Tax=Hyphococcus sp. TaxID=2038636 RepID=UPI0037502C67
MGLTREAALGYEQYFVPAIFNQWPPVLMAAAQIDEGDNLLEVGCGTGVLAREATKLVGSTGSVTGFDLSESMLSVARDICPGVDFRQGNVMALPFDDAAFDVVMAPFMLMFVPDPVKAVEEMWRVLKPRGRFVVAVWDNLKRSEVYSGLVEIAQARIGADEGLSLAWPFSLGEEGKLEEIFRSAGISQVKIDTRDGRAIFPSLEQFVRTEIQSWVLSDKVDEDSVAATIADSKVRFAAFCDSDGAIDMPLHALLASARKN